MDHQLLRATIESAYESRQSLTPTSASAAVRDAVETTVGLLDSGALRVAEPTEAGWQVHEWLKKAVLLYFRTSANGVIDSGHTRGYDKVPLKYAATTEAEFASAGVRVVPGAVVRRGAHVAPNVVLMPCFVNIGAYIDTGTMVDTWATVGSCAQIGRNVHLSGGVGIGGVLEPLQASSTIIEDDCFIGSRCVIVEGALIEEEAVLGANVVITASTQIIDVTGEKELVLKGRVPARSVVIPGVRAKKFPAGEYGVPCALIIGRRNADTDKKVSLNQALRDFAVQV